MGILAWLINGPVPYEGTAQKYTVAAPPPLPGTSVKVKSGG